MYFTFSRQAKGLREYICKLTYKQITISAIIANNAGKQKKPLFYGPRPIVSIYYLVYFFNFAVCICMPKIEKINP